jgi:hypothetical protein
MGWQLGAMAVALCALWVSLDNHRKTTRHLFGLEQCNFISGKREKEGEYLVLSFLLKNLGIEIHEFTLKLVYECGLTTRRVPVSPVTVPKGSPIQGHIELHRGAIARFDLRSTRLDPLRLSLLAGLRDPYAQSARLELCTAGFRVQTIRIGSWRDRLRDVAFRFLRRFRNVPILGGLIPDCSKAEHLRLFAEEIRDNMPHKMEVVFSDREERT